MTTLFIIFFSFLLGCLAAQVNNFIHQYFIYKHLAENPPKIIDAKRSLRDKTLKWFKKPVTEASSEEFPEYTGEIRNKKPEEEEPEAIP